MVDPRMLTDAAEPPYAASNSLLHRLAAEVWDHLWPWSRSGFQRQRGSPVCIDGGIRSGANVCKPGAW